MANFVRCETCQTYHEYDYADQHKCKPVWRVYICDHHDPSDETDGLEVHADDAEEAASKGPRDFDNACSEGPTLNPAEVIVKRAGQANKFCVCGVVQVEYRAKPVVAP